MFNVHVRGRDLRFTFPISEFPSRRGWQYKSVPCTICLVTDRTTKIEIGSANAFCSPKDKFDKNYGRKLALTRFLEKEGYTREERTLIWEAYKKARSGKME